MQTCIRILTLLLLLTLLAGCAGRRDAPAPSGEEQSGKKKNAGPVIVDPAGPIPTPKLPPILAASRTSPAQTAAGQAPPAQTQAPANGALKGKAGSSIAYTVKTSVASAPVSGQRSEPGAQTKPSAAPEASALVIAFEKSSILHRLAETPPASHTGLEQRLHVALNEGREILHSHGYYGGEVTGRIILPSDEGGVFASSVPGGAPATRDSADRKNPNKNQKAEVLITFTPGPMYRMGTTRVVPADPKAPRLRPEETPFTYPSTLSDAGLPEGAPAVAERVLAAVDKIRDMYRDHGYPFASVASTRYIVDHESRTLEAEVRVQPGDFVRMGNLEQHGQHTVRPRYLEALKTWRPGQPWSQSRVEAFRDALRGSGLFQSIDILPAGKSGPDNERPVLVTLEGAPERTVGGAIKYHSDFGPGLMGSWEHRNLTDNGDRLRFEIPLWTDMQEVTAAYRLPFFLDNRQDALAQAGFLNQDTDAYELQSASASAGIERRFSGFWSGSAQVSAEGGFIKDPGEPRRGYTLYGLPLGVKYNSANSLLNASRGIRLMFALTPYTGEYGEKFSVTRTRVDAHAFVPVVGDDTLVLALRGAWGAVTGADAGEVPPSVRFYSGGGGSVRGYEYQSLGPRDEKNKPLGGSSLLELSSEARWKITDEWGVVTFIDGGMAYDDAAEGLKEDMRFGAGLGLRYYTAIGPVRVDLATPLNPREDDDPWQFYLSIGQSF